MNPLFTQSEFDKATSRSLLKLKCSFCKKIFLKPKHYIQMAKKETKYQRFRFCSSFCSCSSAQTKQEIRCSQCNKIFSRVPSQIKDHNFCSMSCSGKWNNAHKTTGSTRSKLELWLEKQLRKLYPKEVILFNDRTTIGAELDIYFPHRKLAFELNGIFHYEPIFGKNKLSSTQNNDQRKVLACAEKGIGLCVIDVTSMKYFKEEGAKKFLAIILNIFNKIGEG